MAFESVLEFDKWTLGFKRQQQLNQMITESLRGSVVEPSQSNMMLNESMSMAANINAGGPIKVLDDDLKSIAPQAPKPKVPRFPTSFGNDQDISSAKKRLQEFQSKIWTLLPKAEGNLIFTDKQVNLSKSAIILDKLRTSQTELIKLQIDFKEKALNVLISFAVYLAVDVLLGKVFENSNSLFLLKTLLAFSLVGMSG